MEPQEVKPAPEKPKEGRPSKYDPSFVVKVDEYLKLKVDEDYTKIKSEGRLGTTYENKVNVKLPTIEGFARFLDISKSTLYLWAKEFPEFSDALEKIMLEQQERLIARGLSGDYNSTIAKLVLASNHGLTDRVDTTSKGEKIYPNPILDVHPDERNPQDQEAPQEDPGGAGRNLGEQDGLDPLDPDSVLPERPGADPDLGGIGELPTPEAGGDSRLPLDTPAA